VCRFCMSLFLHFLQYFTYITSCITLCIWIRETLVVAHFFFFMKGLIIHYSHTTSP
jgi:hypothetical protein